MACMPKGTATARERELYRYYNPALMPCPNSNDNEKTAKKASCDPCLTAFAQLGALRLNARRGLITLSTRDTEFILAESGQKLSLQQDDDEDDKLWHGVGLIQNDVGMAPEITKLFMEKDPPSHVLVGDLSKHERFKDKKGVVCEPHLRAMACVPLKTPLHGIVIGTYIVVDDKIRGPLPEEDLHFLTDMAITVMDYLEAGRVKRQQYRAERMVKAIGLFIEGKTTLREWWLEAGHRYQHSSKKRDKDSKHLEKLADKEFGVQEGTDYFSRNSLHGLGHALESQPQSPASSAPTSTAPSVSGRGDGRPAIPRGDTLLSASDTTVTSPHQVHYDGRPSIPRGDTHSSDSTLVSKSWQERNSSVTTFDTIDHTPDPEKHHQHHSSVSFDLPPENPVGQEVSKELQNAILTSDVRGVFARASNLIREAIGVEGVIYFDASVGSFGGSSDKNVMEEKAPGAFHPDQAITTSEDDLARRSSDTDAMDPPKMEGLTPQNPNGAEKYCNILGFSTRKRSSLRGHQANEEHQRMPEGILRKLLKRYPHGKVFNFDEEGSFSASESDQNPSSTLRDAQMDAGTGKPVSENVRRRNRTSREQEAAAILSVLPGARSVFWFPLWDQNRERWFSGSLVWSTCPTRTLCPVEDITYLAAFGNSTMAEISRLSAQVLSKMKTDFISSISHELRSPLHGVLASVEFLQETQMTEIQADMVSNIHASGKVLLDTINHVLDFSKVNRKSKNKRRLPKKRKQKLGRRESVDDGGEEKADICILSEEVIESIYAGQSVSKKALGLAGHRRHASLGNGEQHVIVIVDIHWRPNWTFEIDAGAWRRVLMNLFSNAMKYTKSGFVKISLEMEEDVASQKSKSRQNLILKVKDNGKGISQEFLKHQLYKPFTQEDSLATGAGLGLSIVKAIVQDLGGRIDFQSEPGTGTEATVRMPLTERLPKADSMKLIGDVKHLVKGLKFNLQCFDMFPDIAETPTGILSSEAEAAMLLKSTLQSTFTSWFEMEQVGSCLPGAQTADVCVIMEAGMGDRSLDDMLEQYHTNHPEIKEGEKLVAVVLTSSYHSGPKVDAHQRFKIFYLQQPYGPHKIAKVLHQAYSPEGHLYIDDNQSEVTSPLSPLLDTASPLLQMNGSPSSDLKDFASITSPPPIPTPIESQTPIPATPTVTPPAPNFPTSEPNPTHDSDTEPVKITTDPPAPAPSPTIQLTLGTAPPKPEGLRVLLVEDNEINLKLLIATMRKLKLDHATATNGLEAFNAYRECGGNFDVVFMDISMPIMSGIESTQHIRRYEKEHNLPPVSLIALTGAANPNTRQEAFSSGVDLFLTKPVPMKALRSMLDDLKREGRGAFAG
ncbi:uncharacterized protein LY89DRAFT_191730 [Mollisia scopiformis]|uniref:histidine kinase n=1 Tax=Mollisia scopiformis TaxID=149040 RepID=A0A194WYR7_MOLSC|nr:uncharacterized protein LY89DRAFT_191730 [Mollisia scopiformis]KUJ12742.1 hypothetical protein LY89DRAFT_191730 [Mollisia scopiformis]